MAGKSGSAVALDPSSGEILAYFSTPAYDPNAFSTGIETALWRSSSSDPEKPLLNRAIQGATRRAAPSRSSTPWPRCRSA